MLGEFMVRLVDHNDPTCRFKQRAQILIAQHATRRIVWRADDRHIRLHISHCLLQGVRVVAQLRSEVETDNFAAEHGTYLPIQRKRRLGDQHALTRSNRNHQQRLNQFVRSISGNNAVRSPA